MKGGIVLSKEEGQLALQALHETLASVILALEELEDIHSSVEKNSLTLFERQLRGVILKIEERIKIIETKGN